MRPRVDFAGLPSSDGSSVGWRATLNFGVLLPMRFDGFAIETGASNVELSQLPLISASAEDEQPFGWNLFAPIGADTE